MIRCTSTVAPPTASERAARNGSAAADTSPSVIDCRTSRDSGPHSPITASSSVTSRIATGAIRVASVQPQPAEVGVDRPGAGDDPEALGLEAGDRHVSDDAAAPVEELGVDDRAGRPVDAVVADALEQSQRAGTAHLDLPERAHVDDPDPLAHRLVLGRDEVEVGRTRPAEAALVLAGAPPRAPGIEVVRALPAVLRAEDRTGLLQAAVERAQPAWAPGLGDVARIAEPVVVLVDLASGSRGELDVAVRAAEAPRPVARDVQLGLARDDQLGDGLAEPSRAAEAVEREPGGHPEAGHARNRAEQGVAVGRHRVRVADERDDPRVLEEREASHGAVHQLREAVVIRRDGTAPVLPGHAVDPAGAGIRLVAAEHDSSGLGLAVDEVVRVPEARRVPRQLVPGDGVERDVLVVDGDRRREGPHHRRHLWRPDPARVDDLLGLDAARVRHDAAHLAALPELDPGHPRSRADAHAELPPGGCDRVGGDVGIDVPVSRHPDRAVQRLRAGRRHEPDGLLGRDQLRLEPDARGPG